MKRRVKGEIMLFAYRKESSEETKQKLRELILYISDKCGYDSNFGMVKLNKIILFADVISYLRDGESITGTEYMKLKNGPVPVHMIQILEYMKDRGEVVIKSQPNGVYIQKRVIPLRNADLDCFTAKDIALVEEVIHSLSRFNATNVSNLSHGTAWKVPAEKDIIPYEAFFLSDSQELTAVDLQEGYNLIKEHGWEMYANA
jgi:hypothetical protein